MFNGYNETPLISFNEFEQEREKKPENVSKWAYGHETGVQSAQPHPNNRQSEFWSGKPNFLGMANMVKCNCSSCYSSSDSQSYQGESTRHRPWLPRTFPVPLNGSTESCKLPGYHQWESLKIPNQGSCFVEGGGGSVEAFPPSQYLQEAGGKHSYYRQPYQNRPEINQPGVITSVKNAEFAKKQKDEMTVSTSVQDAVYLGQNGAVSCNPGHNLTKRIGYNYCDSNEKYSNVASYSVGQQISRLQVVESYIKAVPSLNQNRVPSTGHRNVKESLPQTYIDPGYNKKIFPETGPPKGGEKKPREIYQSAVPKEGIETFQSRHPSPMDLKNKNYSHFNTSRDYGSMEIEAQKLLENECYSKNNFSEGIKRNNSTPMLNNRKDCAMNQVNLTEHHYGERSNPMAKYLDPKSSCEMYCSEKNFDRLLQENPACFTQTEDLKNESNVRLPRSTLIFNDPRFADRGQNSFPYQNNPTAYRISSRPEYPYQGYNFQGRVGEYPHIPQNQYSIPRNAQQEVPNCGVNQFTPQGNNPFVFDPCQKPGSEKTLPQQFFGVKNSSSNLVQAKSQFSSQERLEVKKSSYLETIKSEDIGKNGTSKISPLRLLRKKKFVTPRSEMTPEPVMRAPFEAPALDVRKFLSTWAEEEEECVAPTQMVVLDCQNIDPEQAKLLQLYEGDPLRGVHLESGSVLTVRDSGCVKESVQGTVQVEETPKENEQRNDVAQQEAPHEMEVSLTASTTEWEATETFNRSIVAETATPKTSPSKSCEKRKCYLSQPDSNQGKKKSEDISRVDKWTEKKFDFLKKAEECKAAEVLRHEEEKKKIFQKRLSLHQKKISKFPVADKSGETKLNSPTESPNENLPERLSPFHENSQSNSPAYGTGELPDLPTSEYRRNKFLDYTETKITVNEGSSCKEEKVKETEIKTCPLESSEKSNIQLECLPSKAESEESKKVKDEIGFVEMDDILKKMSEINFHSPDVKMRSEGHPKKVRTILQSKKVKKNRKLEQENEEKLTVENLTGSKPTIKFSIQKSHDLKISFKVLNGSSKKYEKSDEEMGGDKGGTMGNSVEDSENSTELITLKYKSIQREGPNCDLELKKNRRRFRRKKARESPEMKTPVLKIKKTRYLPQEQERDPLGDESGCLNLSKKPYSDGYSTSDDFQVQETVDSAKIKLTFKRHKGNFETEYKINNGVGKIPKKEVEDSMCDETDGQENGTDDWTDGHCRKLNKDLIFCEPDDVVEPFKFEQEAPKESFDVESGLESASKEVLPESGPEEDSRISSSSQESFKNLAEEALASPDFPFDIEFACPFPEARYVSPKELDENEETPEDSIMMVPNGESTTSSPVTRCDSPKDRNERKENPDDKIRVILTEDLKESGQEQTRAIKNCANCDEDIRSTIVTGELSSDCNMETAFVDAVDNKDSSQDFEKEEIQEISLDFIGDTKSPEIDTNDAAGKTESSEIPKVTAFAMQDDVFWNEKNVSSTNEIKHSDNIDSSYVSKSEKRNDDNEKIPFPASSLDSEKSGEKTDCDWRDFAPSQDTDKGPSYNPLIDFVVTDKSFTAGNKTNGSVELLNGEQRQEGSKFLEDAVDFNKDKPGGEDTSGTVESFSERVTGKDVDAESAPGGREHLESQAESEEGEIVDDEDDRNKNSGKADETLKRETRINEFKTNKIERRHSLSSGARCQKESQPPETKFSKEKSCPPEMEFQSCETATPVAVLDIPVADIPLPPGDPPPENCFNFVEYFKSKTIFLLEAKEVVNEKEIKEIIRVEGNNFLPVDSFPGTSESLLYVQNDNNISRGSPSKCPNIFQRTSKIKFSLSKPSKFHAIVQKSKIKVRNGTEETSKHVLVDEATEQKLDKQEAPVTEDTIKKPRTEEPYLVDETRSAESLEEPRVEVTSGDVQVEDEENVEVIDVTSFDGGDFLRDEFYEYEDIPTSEDLPNGMGVEKVPDDDKFRHVMQNCLDNAKRFLNEGNLKLFSCSVDDLLGLDCPLEEKDREKSVGEAESGHHISRDVLLTSCEDTTNDDLGLSEKFQPGDMSIDFVPSFCSDVCPEILPVDNWPYLEEEVPSSPTKSKQDETDLIQVSGPFSHTSEDAVVPVNLNSHNKHDRDRNKARRVFLPDIENGSFRRFRRRSLMTEGESLQMCSKISLQRRKTIESFGGNVLSYGKNCDFENEITRLKNGIEKMENLYLNNNSLKCRLSLEKLTKNENKDQFRGSDSDRDDSFSRTPSKRKYSLDYKSSTWQPKVMLFRISKKELKKMYRHSKAQGHSKSNVYKKSSEFPGNFDGESNQPFKKQKSSDVLLGGITKYVKPEPEEKKARREEKKRFRLSEINSIKGSLSTSKTSDGGKRKKSRFRNLHTKKKTKHFVKEVKLPDENILSTAPTLVDAESVLRELFKDADSPEKRVSDPLSKSTKENTSSVKDTDEKLKIKLGSENRKSCPETHSLSRSREDTSKNRSHDEKPEKRHDHRDRRKERNETEEEYTSEHKHDRREREKKEASRHGRHERSEHGERSPHSRKRAESPRKKTATENSGDGEKEKSNGKELTPEGAWVCQVCGFSDTSERISHIKSHPFHCQSCHLAFKTEVFFISHLTNKHKDIRNQHHCLLCELSFDTENEYYRHLETREHKHLESVEKNTINTLFTLLTGQPCPVLGIVDVKPEWLPNQAGTVHFYHQATPLSLALQYLKMHHSSYSATSSAHSN